MLALAAGICIDMPSVGRSHLTENNVMNMNENINYDFVGAVCVSRFSFSMHVVMVNL